MSLRPHGRAWMGGCSEHSAEPDNPSTRRPILAHYLTTVFAETALMHVVCAALAGPVRIAALTPSGGVSDNHGHGGSTPLLPVTYFGSPDASFR